MSAKELGRSFFNLRFTLPGYTFILLNLLLNLRIVIYFLGMQPLSETALPFFGILFGFLTLLSGTPLGFLVSQVWYLFYFVCYYVSAILPRFGSYKVLKNEFNVKDEIWSLDAAFNYILHSHKEKGIRTYLSRRWDLLMSFGSTSLAIVLGLISGYVCRDFVLNLNEKVSATWSGYDLLIFLPSVGMIFLFLFSYIFVWLQFDRMCTLVIRKRAEKPEKKKQKSLRDVLPEKYFQNDAPAKKGEDSKSTL